MVQDKNFCHPLFGFHLEEISTLYERRSWLKSVNGLGWRGFQDLEKRIGNHVFALSHEGGKALSYCADRLVNGNPGECYGAVRVLSGYRKRGLLKTLIKRMNLIDNETKNEKNVAVSDALCHESPLAFEQNLIHDLLDSESELVNIGLRVAGFHRLDHAFALIDILSSNSLEKNTIIEAVKTMGRLKPGFGLESLLNHLHSRDKDIVDAVITTLSRIGEHNVLKECMAFIGPGGWPLLSLGLYGHKDSLNDSFFAGTCPEIHESSKARADQVLATGLMGNTEMIPGLIGQLDDKDISDNAALALELITGANLNENRSFLSHNDEAANITQEKINAEGTRNQTLNRPCRCASLWDEWWDLNKGFFRPDIRYRLGKPYSPMELVQTLESQTSPDKIRDLAYEEMVIRYGIDIPFETSMPVIAQWKAIAAYKKRLEGNPDAFTKGVWYCNGKPMDNAPLHLSDP